VRRRPPSVATATEGPPPEIALGACIEVWAPDGHVGEWPHFAAWRRYRDGRHMWEEMAGVDPKQSYQLVPGGAPCARAPSHRRLVLKCRM
jgi:hypothetical protein